MQRAGNLIVAVLGVLVPVAVVAGPATPDVCELRSGGFVVRCDRNRGGLIQSVRDARTGRELLTNMHLYTDFGLYGAERGYVGTRSVRAAEFRCRQDGGVAVIHAAGVLSGKPARGKPPVGYRFEATLTPKGVCQFRVGVRPDLGKPKAQAAFLAVQWTLPGLVEFAAHTVKGIVRRRYVSASDRRQRAWQARSLPLDPAHPSVDCYTQAGARLLVRNIRSGGDLPAVGPVIHGEGFFLCWLDGDNAEVHPGKWSWFSWELVLDAGERRQDGQAQPDHEPHLPHP